MSKWTLLEQCAGSFPGRVTTHLIVGLGETETEMADRLASCIDRHITVGLFAFTPIKGTAWGSRTAPPIGSYRRIQVAHHLLRLGYDRSVIHCEQGRSTGFELPGMVNLLMDG